MPTTKRTKPRNPAHDHVRVHEEVDPDDGTTYSIYSCVFCEDYKQKLKHNGPGKPRVKISRFVEHFGSHCKGCPPDVKSKCLQKCKPQVSLFIKSERELREKIKRTTETDGRTQGKDFTIMTNTLAKYYPPLGKYDADRINKSIAKFMAVCGVPFAVAKKESFKEMLKELNPAFVHVNHLKSRDTYRRKFLPTMVAQRFLFLVLLD